MTVTPNRRGRIVMLCVATAVFVATFLLRFLTLEFMNDHFVHLSRGRQILLGDVPCETSLTRVSSFRTTHRPPR